MNEESRREARTVYRTPLSRLRPVVNFANRLKSYEGQSWGPRTISDCQLVYVISGQAEVTIGPQHYRISSGECLFYGADSPHSILSSRTDPVTFSSIHFSWDQDSLEPVMPLPGIRDCGATELWREPASYFIQSAAEERTMVPHHCLLPELEPIFLSIVAEYRMEAYGYQASMRGLLIQLLSLIIRHQRQTVRLVSAQQQQKIEPALEAIRLKPDAHWTTEELARLCGYHPTYFAALFGEIVGEAPKRYIMLERIRRAKLLLLEDLTVEQTANKLGYASMHYFCRSFKEITGLTPTEFKRQMHIL
ncbi:helix-turn-helix domain-containing protein [Paenibacillus sp. TAB 01]|uniref:AraC family transcriptional regulator n=1 Tax=Paenibacillus sp. TAB 01 TaxID=3368988 RepID=UPI0037533077